METGKTAYDREWDEELVAIPRPRIKELRIPLSAAAIGISFPIIRNITLRRPFYAGIQLPILGGIIGYAVGTAVEKWRQQRYSEHWAAIRHYISLHPEEFQMEERKKFAELFEPWHPRR